MQVKPGGQSTMGLNELLEQVEKLRGLVESASATAPSVSGWSVGHHIEHLAMAMRGVTRALTLSSPPRPRGPLRFPWLVIRVTGRIPRGRARAPDMAQPSGVHDAERLTQALDQARQGLIDAFDLPEDKWFQHHALGVMDKRNALRFIRIHNTHHLLIIRDILAAG